MKKFMRKFLVVLLALSLVTGMVTPASAATKATATPAITVTNKRQVLVAGKKYTITTKNVVGLKTSDKSIAKLKGGAIYPQKTGYVTITGKINGKKVSGKFMCVDANGTSNSQTKINKMLEAANVKTITLKNTTSSKEYSIGKGNYSNKVLNIIAPMSSVEVLGDFQAINVADSTKGIKLENVAIDKTENTGTIDIKGKVAKLLLNSSKMKVTVDGTIGSAEVLMGTLEVGKGVTITITGDASNDSHIILQDGAKAIVDTGVKVEIAAGAKADIEITAKAADAGASVKLGKDSKSNITVAKDAKKSITVTRENGSTTTVAPGQTSKPDGDINVAYPPAKTEGTTKFAVLSTTDMHGKTWDKNVLNDTTVNNSMLKVSTAVKDIRSEYDNNVVLIDNGDTFQGTPVSSYNITSSDESFTGETPMAIAMKYIDYDAFILGNHEFNYTWASMQKIYKYLEDSSAYQSVPVLAANLVWDEKQGDKAGKNVFKPYTTKQFAVGGKNFKVGILGLENTDCTRWDIADNYPGIKFSHLDNPKLDMALEADLYVKEMKAEGCDFVIVSYHSGLGSDNVTGDLTFGTNTENQAMRIIKNVSGIDMMITGHDHNESYSNNKYTDKDGKEVLVVNGGGGSLTKTEIAATLTAEGKIEFAITEAEKNISLSTYKDDDALKELVKPYAENATAYVNQVCGKLAEGNWDTKTSSSSCYVEQTDVMDLINRAQIDRGTYYLKQKYGSDYKGVVDFSATSVVLGSFKGLKPGNISMKDIYTFYKYDNSLYVLPVTGAQIKEILEFVASERLDVKFKNGKATFTTKVDSFTCPVFYGLDITYDLAKPKGEMVTIGGFKNGKTFDLKETYNLAINNYHLSNGPFAPYKPADTIWSQTDDLGGGAVQDLIKEFLEAAGENGITPDRSNWKIEYSGVIPEEPVVKPVDSFDPIPNTMFDGDYKTAITIKEAAKKEAGTGTVIGQVVGSADERNHFIEDVVDGNIYGYLIYDNTDSSGNSYKKGDIVAVTGEFLNYNGLPEIKPAKDGVKVLKSLGEDFMIAPQVMEVKDLKEWNENYINETVIVRNATVDNGKVSDASGSLAIYMPANFPDGITKDTKVDAKLFYSIGNNAPQFRNTSSQDYKVHTDAIYDPIEDKMFTTEKKLSDVYGTAKDEVVTVIGQVTEKFSTSNNAEGNRSNIILQDVINGKVTGIVVYDSANFADYKIGDVVKVTGKVSEYSTVKQITANEKPEVLKVEVQFQPQKITLSQLSEGNLSQLVKISDVTLGSYNGSGDTTLTDATGNTVILKGAELPNGVKQGDVIDVVGVCTKKNAATFALRVPTSYDYISHAGSTAPEVDKDLLRLPVFETTDVHGFLLDVSSGDPSTYQYRLAYISDKVKDAKVNGDTLLLDGGDIYQGNPVSNLLQGQSMIAAYDEMGYDAVALGNHEFDWGVTTLIDADGTMGSYDLSNSAGAVKGDSQIPVVCGNIYNAGTEDRVNFTKDYVIVEKEAKSINGAAQKMKIAIFGYADDYSADIMAAMIAPYKIDESKLADIQASAKALEEAGTVDASILLSHAGASTIANALEKDTAFDLVLGGHTHMDAKGVSVNGVPYLQTKNQAQSYGYLELCMDSKTKKISVENADNNGITSDKTALYDTEANKDNLDANIIKISKISAEQVAPIMNVQLGSITTQVTKTAINGNAYSSTAGTWMTELMNGATKAKVSFTNNGGIRTEYKFTEPSRMLTAGDIYTIAPFCNLLPTFELTYKELIDLIQYAVGAGSSLGLRMGGATAYYEAGVVKTLFIGNTLVYNNGVYEQGYQETDTLVVCTNEYIATASGTPFAAKTSIEASKGETPLTDNEAFIDYLKKESAQNGGALHVNTEATIVSGNWDGVTIPTDYSTLVK